MKKFPELLLAFDSFKGCRCSVGVAKDLARGLTAGGYPGGHIGIVGLGDGGEGSADALLLKGVRRWLSVPGPDGEEVQGQYLMAGGTAWVESASACGIEVSQTSGPERRSTAGVGCLILAALGEGATRVVVGCGGTGTIDVGLGMLEVLGARIEVAPEWERAGGLSLRDLEHVRGIDLSGARDRLEGVEIIAAVDVFSPLCGADGAVLYACQKGLPTSKKSELEETLRHVAGLFNASVEGDICELDGAGAAGGLGAALLALGGEVRSGFEMVAEGVNLNERLESADIIITGEGRLDATTFNGKVVQRVLQRAQQCSARSFIVSGQATVEGIRLAKDEGVEEVFTLVRGGEDDPAGALVSASERLVAVGRRLAPRLMNL